MTMLSTLPLDAAAENLPEDLKGFVARHRAQLQNIEVPHRRTEAWKYSAKRLGTLDELEVNLNTDVTLDEDSPLSMDRYQIKLVNGQPWGALPEIEGVQFKRFSELSEHEVTQLEGGVSAQSEDLPFARLNDANMQDGLFIHVQAGAQVDKPLHLQIMHRGSGMSFPRIFVLADKSASLTLIEELSVSGDDDACGFANSICDFKLDAGARMTFFRMNLDDGEQKHLGATGIQMGRDTYFESHTLTLGSAMGRHDLRVRMTAPGGECSLNGVCLTRDRQHFDNHTCIEHEAPNCISNENYRCIAADKSQIVFNGRIHIHPHAQKTEGAMSNKNLLLSSSAEIDAKPELEIYADDVKCAHGTTIGQLDKQEIYYLRTRGIDEDQARQILTLGFVLEVVRSAPISEIAEFWEATLTRLLRSDDIAAI